MLKSQSQPEMATAARAKKSVTAVAAEAWDRENDSAKSNAKKAPPSAMGSTGELWQKEARWETTGGQISGASKSRLSQSLLSAQKKDQRISGMATTGTVVKPPAGPSADGFEEREYDGIELGDPFATNGPDLYADLYSPMATTGGGASEAFGADVHISPQGAGAFAATAGTDGRAAGGGLLDLAGDFDGAGDGAGASEGGFEAGGAGSDVWGDQENDGRLTNTVRIGPTKVMTPAHFDTRTRPSTAPEKPSETEPRSILRAYEKVGGAKSTRAASATGSSRRGSKKGAKGRKAPGKKKAVPRYIVQTHPDQTENEGYIHHGHTRPAPTVSSVAFGWGALEDPDKDQMLDPGQVSAFHHTAEMEAVKYDPWAMQSSGKPKGGTMGGTGGEVKKTTVKKLRDRPKSKKVLRTKLLKRKAPVTVTRLTVNSLGQKMAAPAKFRQVSQALKSASQGKTDMTFER